MRPAIHPLAVEPASADVDPERLAALYERVERCLHEDGLPSAQLALARRGKLVAARSWGRVARGHIDAEATNDTLYVIYSSTKAITSAAAWLLMQEGKLGVDERVADVIPEFAANGKDRVTVEQLFTHTAGFPNAPFRPPDWDDRSRRLERFASWRLNWQPGSRLEYHPTSSMWVIAELVERRSGVDFRSFVRGRIALPLGLEDLYLGLPEEENARVADVVHFGEALTDDELRAVGFPVRPENEVTEDALERFNHAGFRRVGVPGGGGITTATDLALFYQALLRGGRASDGTEIWQPDMLAEALRSRTGELRDAYTGVQSNRGLGVCVAGDEQRSLRGFGKTNSPDAFGHNGAGGQIAWADPQTGISFVFLTNGVDRNLLRMGRRGVALSSRAATCAAECDFA